MGERSSRPRRRSRKKRLRHLLTICRGVSRRAAMASLSSPSAAYSTILARMTSRYGDVYFRPVASSRGSFRNGEFNTVWACSWHPLPRITVCRQVGEYARPIRHRSYGFRYSANCGLHVHEPAQGFQNHRRIRRPAGIRPQPHHSAVEGLGIGGREILEDRLQTQGLRAPRRLRSPSTPCACSRGRRRSDPEQ